MIWRYFLFFLFALTLIGGAHYYIWIRLVRDLVLSQPWRQLATVAIIALGVSLPLSLVLQHTLSREVGRVILWPIYIWMGLMFLLVFALALGDLGRLIIIAGSKLAHHPLSGQNRFFVKQIITLMVMAVVAALGIYAVRAARGPVQVRKITVELARLPQELSGITLVELCDLHLGPTLGREFVEGLVKKTNSLKPDVIAIVGDLVDGPVSELRDVVAPLGELRARYGVFFVTGNHEYYISRDGVSGANAWAEELKRLGIRVLHNERVAIGHGSSSFDLAGVDDWSARGLGQGMNLEQALAGRDATRELVLLAHQPRAIFQAAQHAVGLVLSGHTHGGQIWPWQYVVPLQQPYVAGLARHGAAQIYVSSGTGYWGPPMRLGTSSEITQITLVAPDKTKP